MSTASSTSPTPRVLIVGAGPVGLVAALALLGNGIQVRLIEKSTTPRIGQRGAGIHPRTVELFESLGFLDKVLKSSILVPKMRLYKLPGGTEVVKEFEMVPRVAPTPDRPHTDPRLLGQEVLDKIAQSELKEKYGYAVELGVELKALEQVSDQVHVKLEKHTGEVEAATYDYVIGADGARGSVRKLLGLSFLGETRTEQTFLIGDFFLEGLSEDRWHMWGDISHVLVSTRPTETKGLFNFIIAGTHLPEFEDTDQAFLDFFKKHTGGREDIKISKLVYKGYYKVNIRMVDTYSKGRVFVAGDAAHIHSPTGGQGLNTGVQDSFNLAWKLALVLKGLAPQSLLDTYTAERLIIAAEMLEITTGLLTKTIAATDPSHAAAVFNRGGKLNQFGVNCRSSSIVLDDGLDRETAKASSAYGDSAVGPLYAGDRAPDAPGLVKEGEGADATGTRLFQLFSPTRHTVLVFADKLGAAFQSSHAIFSRYPLDLVRIVVIGGTIRFTVSTSVEVYRDRDGHAHEAYKDAEALCNVFVVRPDGYVGARLANCDGVETYFKGIFGDRV